MADDVASLQAMFPSIDVDLIRDVYEAAHRSFDAALNTLLEMVDPSQAEVVQREKASPSQAVSPNLPSQKGATMVPDLPSDAARSARSERVDRRAFQTEEEQLQDDADEALARQLAQQEQDEAYALALHQQEIERVNQQQQRQQQQQQAQQHGEEEEEDFLDGVEKKLVALKESMTLRFHRCTNVGEAHVWSNSRQ